METTKRERDREWERESWRQLERERETDRQTDRQLETIRGTESVGELHSGLKRRALARAKDGALAVHEVGWQLYTIFPFPTMHLLCV